MTSNKEKKMNWIRTEKNKNLWIRTGLAATCLLAILIFIAGPASAAPLNLDLFENPDIMSGYIDVSYAASSNSFTASGFAMKLDDDGVGAPMDIKDGTFEIVATIDETGDASSGTLTINGTLPANGNLTAMDSNNGTLLTGDLTDFGFPDAGGDPFEFLFNVTGGDCAGLYEPVAGVILTNTGFGGTFTSNFDNLIGGVSGTGAGLADTGVPVPAPAALSLLLFGIAGLCAVRKRIG